MKTKYRQRDHISEKKGRKIEQVDKYISIGCMLTEDWRNDTKVNTSTVLKWQRI